MNPHWQTAPTKSGKRGRRQLKTTIKSWRSLGESNPSFQIENLTGGPTVPPRVGVLRGSVVRGSDLLGILQRAPLTNSLIQLHSMRSVRDHNP